MKSLDRVSPEEEAELLLEKIFLMRDEIKEIEHFAQGMVRGREIEIIERQCAQVNGYSKFYEKGEKYIVHSVRLKCTRNGSGIDFIVEGSSEKGFSQPVYGSNAKFVPEEGKG